MPAMVPDTQRILAQATTEEDLHALLETLQEQDEQVTAQMDKFIADTQITQQHDIKRLNMLRTELSTALNSSHEISRNLASAAYGSSRISSKVRSIDAEKERVKESLQYVEDAITLRSSISGCHEAMGRKDWEQAANYIHRARLLRDELIDGEFAKVMVPNSELPDIPRDAINEAAKGLADLFLREFGKAAEHEDMANVTRYFKLFPLIGQEREGLDVYAKFICGIITAQSRKLMQASLNKDIPFYGMAVAKLFENIASIVAQHSPIVEKHYGKGRMGRVVDKIQNEADSQGGLIVDTYWDERRLDHDLAEIKAYSFPFLVSSFSRAKYEPEVADNIDSRHVGELLNEASIILNRWELYKRFLAARWDDFQQETHGFAVPQFLVNSRFNQKLQDKLIPAFETMGTFVFRRSVELAFQKEILPDLWGKSVMGSPLVTTTCNDVMNVMKNLMVPVLSTGDVPLIKTIIGNVRRILESDYVGVIQRKLREEAQRQGAARSGTPPPGKSLANMSQAEDKRWRVFLIHLNGLSTISLNVEELTKSQRFDLPFDSDASSVRDSLQGLMTSFKGRCNELIDDGLRTIFNSVLKSKFSVILGNVTRHADYIGSNDEDTVSGEFITGWDNLMTEFVNVLTPELYTRLASLIAQFLSKALERWIWTLQGKVDDIGAIRLDRDVGRIITKASSERYHFREKFVRVAQIVTIVGLDDAEDEEAVAWALTPEERQKARQININNTSTYN